MNRTIVRVAPIRAAIVSAVIYFIMGILIVPFFLLPVLTTDEAAGFGVYLALALPILYAIGGFIGTALMCVLYNFVAGRIGGIQIHVESHSPPQPGAV